MVLLLILIHTVSFTRLIRISSAITNDDRIARCVFAVEQCRGLKSINFSFFLLAVIAARQLSLGQDQIFIVSTSLRLRNRILRARR
jgi:hypothetical protein